MKKTWIVLLLVLFAVFGFSGDVSATLTTIGTATYNYTNYNLIFEGELGSSGLVWLDYLKLPATWADQVTWASGLGGSLAVTVDPDYTTNIVWSTGWRLPIVDESKANLSIGYGYKGPDETGYHNYSYAYNMVNGEMGHLYYASLMNKGIVSTGGVYPQPGWGLTNTGPFNRLRADGYWSGTEYSLDTSKAWYIDLYSGYQYYYVKTNSGDRYAMAVHEGVVNSVPIPEPASMLLFGSGLLAWVGLRRRFKK